MFADEKLIYRFEVNENGFLPLTLRLENNIICLSAPRSNPFPNPFTPNGEKATPPPHRNRHFAMSIGLNAGGVIAQASVVALGLAEAWLIASAAYYFVKRKT